MGVDIKIHHMPELASWTVDARQLGWISPSVHRNGGPIAGMPGELLADALNSRVPQIFDTIKDGDSERRVLNVVDTEAAKEKLQKIKDGLPDGGSGPIPIAPTGWRAFTTTASTISRHERSTAPI
jgi:N12 class adenine-specific DNA methylase